MSIGSVQPGSDYGSGYTANTSIISSVLETNRMIRVRNELIPLVHLGAILHRATEAWNIENGIVMIVKDMLGKKIGLFLDEIIGQYVASRPCFGLLSHDKLDYHEIVNN